MSHDVEAILSKIRSGDDRAADRLVPLLYDELRSAARRLLAREPAGHSLQPTALVHDAYLRLLGDTTANFESLGHFYSAAAIAMRRILVERARRRARLRHGGLRTRLDLDDAEIVTECPALAGLDVIALDEALVRLEQFDRRAHDVVLLRYFAGLDVDETARALGISPRTVKREWSCARLWLLRELSKGEERR